ncbi:MAG: VWA domain-containing protein [Candidatus Acidiferrales bacterium]
MPSRVSRGFAFSVLAAVLILAGLAPAQNPPPATDLPATVLRVTTRLILVDVIVSDKDGRPVPGLTRDDFVLLEDGNPQTIAAFSFENPASRAAGWTPPPHLPPNVYTNRPQHRTPPGPLTILLLDSLNTPWRDQAYMRQEMLKYIRTQVRPDQRVAILALTNNLIVLQDFTTDSRLLLAALERFAGERSVELSRAEPVEIPASALATAPPDAVERITAGLDRFNAEQVVLSTDSRVVTTLAALRVIARATAGYPGRKNLVWVSAAFPFTLAPERSGNMDMFRSYATEVRRTASVLTDAQVAVYPVDARGLVGATFVDVSSPSDPFRIVSSHATMNQLAHDTGGKAYYNRNDIDVAVNSAVADGASYYSLAYYPEDKKWDGKFRRIEVKLNRAGLQVRYRRGYYATDTVAPERAEKSEKKSEKDELQEMKSILSDPLPATAITFVARVQLPAPADKELMAEFRVDATTLRFDPAPDGRRFKADFLVAAVSPDGRIVTSASRTVEAALNPQQHAAIQQSGLPFKLPLALVPGRYQRLRLVVRDHLSGLAGAVDVPLTLTVAD